jgi:hypothetical protein
MNEASARIERTAFVLRSYIQQRQIVLRPFSSVVERAIPATLHPQGRPFNPGKGHCFASQEEDANDRERRGEDGGDTRVRCALQPSSTRTLYHSDFLGTQQQTRNWINEENVPVFLERDVVGMVGDKNSSVAAQERK